MVLPFVPALSFWFCRASVAVRAFSVCRRRGSSLVAAPPRLRCFSCRAALAPWVQGLQQLPCSTCDLSGPGITSVSPALAGGVLTTGPLREAQSLVLFLTIIFMRRNKIGTEHPELWKNKHDLTHVYTPVQKEGRTTRDRRNMGTGQG